MKYNIKGLVLETVSEVLLEGRLEDVKAKYPEENANVIDRLSQGDPSGNNKYLAWMADQYITVGQGLITLNEIIDVVKRFHNEQARINPNMSKEIVASNPQIYQGREVRRVSNNPKDISSYSSLAGLIKVVEAAEENTPSSTERDKIYQDDKWTVIVPKTHQASCKYGVHSNWCVSTSNAYYYKNYTESGMLAFVLWRGKQEGEIDSSREGEYKVAAYIKFNNPDYKNWEWYNKKDTRMDNDLPISIFPPTLINAIGSHLKTAMRNQGFIVDIDENELEEKSHILSITGPDDNRSWIFTPKETGTPVEWLSKYDKNNRMAYALNPDWSVEIPLYRLTEPSGKLEYSKIDLSYLYRVLKNNSVNSRRRRQVINLFNEYLPYELRNSWGLPDEKKTELFQYVKEYFQENFKGYMEVNTTSLEIGDNVRWERKPRREQRRLGHKKGKIVRQTPSGMFVVDIVGEDKPSRFKPDSDKYMDKQYQRDNLDMSVWEDPTE